MAIKHCQARGNNGDRPHHHQLELKNVTVSTVKPAEKFAHAEKYDIALFDAYLIDMYVPVLMLFKPDPQAPNRLTASGFVRSMKQSLSRALVPYYTFAGRFRKTYDLRLRELLCNDDGVPFIAAEIDQDMDTVVNLDDFQPLSILSGYEFVGLDPVSLYQANADSPLPAVFIQVTKFKCGGISVNVSFLHMVGDGKAMFQFLNDWSQMTLDDQISFERIHDRSLTYPLSILLDMLAAPGPSTESESENLEAQKKSHHEVSESSSVDDGVNDQMNKLNVNGSNGSAPVHPPPPVTSTSKCNAEEEDDEKHKKKNVTTTGNVATDDSGLCADVSNAVDIAIGLRFPLIPEWSLKTLHVRRESVLKLKEMAKDRAVMDGFVPTSLDCINSNIWRGLSRIPSSVDGRKSTMFGLVTEGRKRLHNPPIPDSYSGNDFLLMFSEAIEKPSDDRLVEASIIHHMVQNVTPQSWLGSFVRALLVMKDCGTSDVRSFFVSSWYRFPMYEPDFGYGKPILATYNTVSSTMPAGYAIITPPRPGSDYLATVQFFMAPDPLQAMLNDPEFRSFFH